jgi:prevent-host-death family protein
MSLRAESAAIREVGVRQLKSEVAAVLDAVVNGERVIVTKHGHPIAVILSIEQAADLMLTGSEEFVRMRLRGHDELDQMP